MASLRKTRLQNVDATLRILAISTSKLCCIKVSKVLMLTVWVG